MNFSSPMRATRTYHLIYTDFSISLLLPYILSFYVPLSRRDSESRTLMKQEVKMFQSSGFYVRHRKVKCPELNSSRSFPNLNCY
jgi:hypothetical protein